MYKLDANPLTLSGVLKNGWQLYKASLKYVLIWSLILAIIHIIPYLYGFVGFFQQDAAGRLAFSWWGLLFSVALLFVEAFFVAVLFYTMYLNTTESQLDLPATIRHAAKVLLILYFGMIVYSIAVSIGIVVFVFPAVFLGILFSMFLPYIIFENRHVYQAFESSARLVWGNWWQTFFALFVPYVLIYLARNILKFSPWMGEWMLIIDLILLTVAIPYYYAVLLVQFVNLKVIKSLPEPISSESRTEVNPD